ncbi:MAG: protein kinase, partial [Myxococcota bacterium]
MTEIRIQRCLGRGGFGEVYKGTMLRPGGVEVEVAIKVLRGDLAAETQGLQRMRDEGRLLGRLTHPTILRVYDLVFIDGRPALVSEYVPGADLGRLVREDRVPARAAFEVIAQIAAALDAAWSWPSVGDNKPLHLIHRDIKPDNIRIDPHGVVKLLDFGIAQAKTVEREAQTSSNTIMGSTQYLAPERLVQQEVGPESDVFALGCTLFEVLTGEALFARRSMRQMYLLMVQEERYEQFMGERCGQFRERLGNDRSIALIRAMTAWRKSSRPSSAEVAARCDAISDGTDGPTLTLWCRSRVWPPPPEIDGPLDGRSFGMVPSEWLDAAGLAERLEPPQAANVIRPDPPPVVTGAVDPPGPTGETLSRSLHAAGAPVPWSSAEVVAVFPTARPPRERVPQLERLWPEPLPAVPVRAEVAGAPTVEEELVPTEVRTAIGPLVLGSADLSAPRAVVARPPVSSAIDDDGGPTVRIHRSSDPLLDDALAEPTAHSQVDELGLPEPERSTSESPRA